MSGRASVTAALLAGLLVALAPAVPAAAAPPPPSDDAGGVTWDPPSGSAQLGITATSAGPCPAEAEVLLGRLSGPGLPAEGIVVIPPSPLGLSTTGPMAMPLQNSLFGFAEQADVDRLDGTYRFALVCSDAFGATDLRTYATPVVLTQEEGSALETATYDTSAAAVARASGDDGRSVLPGLAVTAGFAAVGGAAALVLHRRRRPAAPSAPTSAVDRPAAPTTAAPRADASAGPPAAGRR